MALGLQDKETTRRCSKLAAPRWRAMKGGIMRKELRKQSRYQLQLPVEIEWQSNTGNQKDRGFTRDVSSKGVFLFCESEIPLDAHLHLVIFLRTDELGPMVTLDVFAKVCRVVKPLAEDDLSGLAVQNSRCNIKSILNGAG
jgi:PilZ domain